MTNVVRLTLLTIAISGVLTAPAFAGGGSTKSKPELTVKNDTNEDVYVIVNPRNTLQADIIARIQANNATTFGEAFMFFGGTILNPDEEASFTVRKGDHTVAAADAAAVDAVDLMGANPAAQIAAEFEDEKFNVQSDRTVQVSDIL